MNAKVLRKDKANFLSKLTLWWIVDLLWRGRLKPINQNDLDPVREEDRSEYRTELLEKTWRNEKISANQARRKPKLWKAMLKCFSWKEYGLLSLTCFSSISGNILYRYSTLKLIYSVLSITAHDLQSRNQYLVNVWGMIIGSILTNFGIRHFNLITPILGIKSRAAVVGMIYKKVGNFITLSVSIAAEQVYSHIVNVEGVNSSPTQRCVAAVLGDSRSLGCQFRLRFRRPQYIITERDYTNDECL